MSFFDESENRRGTDSVKWDKNVISAIASNPDADAFWVADMDFKTEPHIKERAIKEAERGIFGYPTESPIIEYFASWCKKRHDWILDKDKTVFVSGLLHGIALALDLFTKGGDYILIPSPTYKPFRELCADSGRVMLDLPLRENGDGTFSFPMEKFKEEARKCKMILFCSPHNPSGIVFSKDELEEVLKTAKELNIPVISDEIHADLVHPKAHHITMGKANEEIGADVITYLAPSKTFNLAGEHAAFAVFSNEKMLLAFMKKQKALRVTTPGYMIKQLMSEAYLEGYDYIMELSSYLEGTLEEIDNYLKENCPDIKLSNGGASFVVFMDFSRVFEKIKERVESNPERYKVAPGGGILSIFFGVDANVCMNDGTWFGAEYEKYTRFNYGTSRDLCLDAIKRIVEAVKSL